MASKNVDMDQSTPPELMYVGFVREIMVKLLVLLSNVYDFAKQIAGNIGVLKSIIISVENIVVSRIGPIFQKLKDFADKVLEFIDNKFDKYAPPLFKMLAAKLQSVIMKAIAIVDRLLTTIIPIAATLAGAVLYLPRKLVSLLQKVFSTSKSVVQSPSLVGTAQSILQKGPDMANQLVNASKSLAGDIPFIGQAAQSVISNTADLANQALDSTNSLAKTLITNPADLANQVLDTANTLVKDTPVLGAVSSEAQNLLKEVQATGLKLAFQSAFTSFKLVALPIIANFWYKLNTYPIFHAIAQLVLPIAEYFSKLYNKVVSYMSRKGCLLFSYFPLVPVDEMEAAYKVVKTAMDGLSAMGGLLGMGDN